jgi:hypothetical protein
MKRFLYFTGDTYYPNGGWRDYHLSFDTFEEAETYAKKYHGDWWHIVDTQTMEIIVSGYKRGG